MKTMKTTLLYVAAASLALVDGSVQADPASNQGRGKMLYESRCIGCHSLDSNRTGPAHRGVFGRRAGVVPGYDYSPALKASGLVWTKENLDLWLTDPEKLVPGQKMGYSVPDARDRSDLVAYLKSLDKDGPWE